MSQEAVAGTVFDKIMMFAQEHELGIRICEHEPEGRTDVVSRVRGNDLDAAVKAMCIMIKLGKTRRKYVLACVPGDRRVDLSAIKRLSSGSDARFAPEDRAVGLTGCEMGSVPPISFNDDLEVLVDPALLDKTEVVFNAGRLDRSLFVAPKPWFEAARASVANIAI